MKDPFERTKVVLRHLPPAISQSVLMEQIDSRFTGRYKWVCFRPGKNSQKNQWFSRAYIDFEKPEDVVEFAEFFDGHVFVNEKGAQFKTLVEYAPSQRVPKSSKKDGREGTIFKDPEYLEFLEFVAKPAENLPSAEIQLERREAERAGSAKEMVIVTPLMEFVRQRRAAKSGSQKPSANGKASRRSGGISSSPLSSKRGSEKRRVSTPIYVLRDSTKSGIGKDKPTSILVSKRDGPKSSDKAAANKAEALEDETGTGCSATCAGATGIVDAGKKKLVLLKGKEREASNVPVGTSQQAAISPARGSSVSTAFKHSQRHGASGKIIRSILSKEARQSQSQLATYNSEQQLQITNLEKDKRPPRPPNSRLVSKDHLAINLLHATSTDNDIRISSDDKVAINDSHAAISTGERQDRRIRKKDRLDRVWTPLRRADGSNASDDSVSSSSALTAHALSEVLEGMTVSAQVAGVSKSFDDDSGNQSSHLGLSTGSSTMYDTSSSHIEMKSEMHNASRSEGRGFGSGRGRHSVVENSSHRHVGRRGASHGSREADVSLNYSEAKNSKRGPTGYGSHEASHSRYCGSFIHQSNCMRLGCWYLPSW